MNKLKELKRKIDKSPYYKKVGMQTIICKLCGEEFQAPTRNTKLCSKCKKLKKIEQRVKSREKYKLGKIPKAPKKKYETKIVHLDAKVEGTRAMRFVRDQN